MKAQASLEKLMIYGFAILIIVVAISVLYSQGVLNPRKAVPDTCFISTGIACNDFIFTNDSILILSLSSGIGDLKDININATNCLTLIGNGVTLKHSTKGIFVFDCSNVSFDFYKGEISLEYTDFANLRKKVIGKVSVKRKDVTARGALNNSLVTFEIYNPNPFALKDFQVRINLSQIESDSGISLVGKDIRIFDRFGEVNFCYEQKNGECNESKSNIVWLKTSLSSGSNLLRILANFGDGSKDGNSVFDFYDDFSSSTLNTSKWDTFAGNGYYQLSSGQIKFWCNDGVSCDWWTSNNYAVRIRTKSNYNNVTVESRGKANGGDSYETGITIWKGTSTIGCTSTGCATWRALGQYISTVELLKKTLGSTVYWQVYDHEDNWIRIKVDLTPSVIYVIFYDDNGNEIWSRSDSDTLDSSYYIGLMMKTYRSNQYAESYFDWFRVRKYASSEPYYNGVR